MKDMKDMKDMKELEESIERFLHFFSKHTEKIRVLDCNQSTPLFRKILYSSLLDALSKTTAHPKKANRERIGEFIRNFCDWPFCEKISLPHLVRFLEKVPDPAFSKLRQYAFSLLDKWEESQVIHLNKDPDFQDVKKRWPKDIPKPLEDIQIEFLQHVNLLYRYRNSLVHELRKPGYGKERTGDLAPFYHFMTHHIDTETNQKTWELVYPMKFYENLCNTAINNLRDYYRKNRIDPYSCYIFGTYWIEELNE